MPGSKPCVFWPRILWNEDGASQYSFVRGGTAFRLGFKSCRAHCLDALVWQPGHFLLQLVQIQVRMQALDLTVCLASNPISCMIENIVQVIHGQAGRRSRIRSNIVGVRKVNLAVSAAVNKTNRNRMVRGAPPCSGVVSPFWAQKMRLRGR